MLTLIIETLKSLGDTLLYLLLCDLNLHYFMLATPRGFTCEVLTITMKLSRERVTNSQAHL